MFEAMSEAMFEAMFKAMVYREPDRTESPTMPATPRAHVASKIRSTAQPTMRILSIETSTDICSVAITENGTPTFVRLVDRARKHGEVLAPMISQAFEDARHRAGREPLFDGVAVSSGPGSYTGLRIGVSSAKAIALARSIPLIAAPTLECLAMAYASVANPAPGLRILSTLQARTDEWYVALYERSRDRQSQWNEIEPATIVDGDALRSRSESGDVDAAISDEDVPLDARFAALIGEQRLGKGLIEDLGSFEPSYLRDFVARKPKQSIFDRLRF